MRPLTLAVALLSTLAAGYAAWREDWTYDERIHVAWSERFLEAGETERLSQKRFNSKTTIIAVNVAARRAAERLGVKDPRALRFAARLPTIGWLLALLAGVYLFARAFFGETAAHLATLAAALDPNLIGHGSLATNDVSFALGALLTLGAGVAFMSRPSLPRGFALGLALGFAFAAKLTAVLLLPSLALLPLALVGRPTRAETARLAGGLVAAAVAACLVLSAAYLFRGLAEPLSATVWRSAALARLAHAFPGLALPLPTGFLTGFDFMLGFESPGVGHRPVADWNIVMLGRRYPQGVWFYFGLLWLLKTPLLVVVAIVAGVATAARRGLLLRHPAARYLAANLALWLVYLSFFFKAQIGYRIALLCVPPAAMLAAAGLATLRGRTVRMAGIAVLVTGLAEVAFYAGNPLAFTNAAVWPKRQVFRLITDSNLDWGQNREKIEDWLARAGASEAPDPVHVLPGFNTFSVNALAGVWDFEQHRWLREHADPGGHFGHTYLWFEVDETLYAQFLAENRRLAPRADAQAHCGDEAGMVPLGPRARVDFSLGGPLPEGEAWVVCVATPRSARFGLRAVGGHALFGPYAAGADVRWERLEEGQVAWYLLDPGTHALALARIPNRRAALPNEFDGRWLVRGRGLALSVRRGTLDVKGVVRAAAPPEG